MKNNKIFNRTFKVSLVAMALGLVNSAWATDLTCSNSTGCRGVKACGSGGIPIHYQAVRSGCHVL